MILLGMPSLDKRSQRESRELRWRSIF